MMSAYFPISPSEALLIGRCFGHYEAARRDREHAHFLFYLDRHLAPFTPQVSVEKMNPVGADSIPSDCRWFERPDDDSIPPVRTGYSSSDAQAYFLGCGGWTARVWRDQTARFLPQQLVELIDGLLVRRTLRELATYPPDCGRSWGQHQVALWQDPHGFADPQCNDTEDASKIAEQLTSLVSQKENDYAKLFHAGRLFGTLHYLCDCADATLWSDLFDWDGEDQNLEEEVGQVLALEVGYWEPMGWDTFCGMADEAIGKLLASGTLPLSSPARSILRAPWDSSSGGGPAAAIFDTRTLSRFREAVAMAMGDIMAVTRKGTEATVEMPIGPTLPQYLRLTSNSPVEKIGPLITWIEEAMVRGNTPPAESIVSMLAPGIEALTKRIRPIEFGQRAKSGELTEVLHAIASRGSENERRFANLALSLHKAYRNAVQHQFDRFSCTLQEAFTFLQTMKTLLHLSNEIVGGA